METNPNRKYDIENRLIDFADMVIDIIEQLPNNIAAKHLGGQLVRSCTAPALNYGEAQGAESRADFIHKMGIILKELRESRICLQLLLKRRYGQAALLEKSFGECTQLVAIIAKSIKTAKENLKK